MNGGGFPCTYCCLTFSDKNHLRAHCQSESHQTVIMSDEGRDWKWRPPPRGYTCLLYTSVIVYCLVQCYHYHEFFVYIAIVLLFNIACYALIVMLLLLNSLDFY